MTAAVVSPRARRELVEAARWIARDNPAAARALRDAVAKVARQLGEHPNTGVPSPDLADPPVRFLPLTGFPYIIVDGADGRPPLILRILQGARDLPGVFRAP